jgi:hypothetical protein
MWATLYMRYPVRSRLAMVACISLVLFACGGGTGMVPGSDSQLVVKQVTTVAMTAAKVRASGATALPLKQETPR